MEAFIKLRASEILDQDELVELMKLRLTHSIKPIGNMRRKGYGTVEAILSLNSPELEEIRSLIFTKRKQGVHGYTGFTLGQYVRTYTDVELRRAELLQFTIKSHFEPAGDECGTLYETLCPHCNLARQMSDLILDLRRMPRKKDIAETIALVEWVVSSKLANAFSERGLSGAKFQPVFEFKNPMKSSAEWHQLKIVGRAGAIADHNLLGRDPFSPSELEWRCPLGHSVHAQLLSELYIRRDAWDGSDISVTSSLFGQGRNLLQPFPLIIISQRMYRSLQEAGIKGYSVEVAHLV